MLPWRWCTSSIVVFTSGRNALWINPELFLGSKEHERLRLFKITFQIDLEERINMNAHANTAQGNPNKGSRCISETPRRLVCTSISVWRHVSHDATAPPAKFTIEQRMWLNLAAILHYCSAPKLFDTFHSVNIQKANDYNNESPTKAHAKFGKRKRVQTK